MSLEFVNLFRPTREGFLESITPLEQGVMGEHFHYLETALKNGKLVLAGPCLDASFGVMIFRAESLEAAQAFVAGDPAVANGVFRAEVRPFRISLLAGRD